MAEDLKALLSNVAEQQVVSKASRRKALSEELLKNPDILSNLENDLSAVIDNVPAPLSSATSESHWTSRLSPEWTAEKVEALNPLDLAMLMHTPELSPAQVEHIAQTT